MPVGDGTSRYTPELHAQIIDLAKKGNWKATIARAVRLHPDTLHTWFKLGRDEPEKYPHFAQLVEDFNQAEAEWELTMVDRINVTANSGLPNTWQAGMTMLERKFPDRWGKRDTTKIETDRPLISIGQVVLGDPDARRDTRALLRRITGSGSDIALGPGVGDESAETADIVESTAVEVD